MEELIKKIADARPRDEYAILRCWWDAQRQARELVYGPTEISTDINDDF